MRVREGEVKCDSQVSGLGNRGHCGTEKKINKKKIEEETAMLHLIYVKDMIKRAKIHGPYRWMKSDTLAA